MYLKAQREGDRNTISSTHYVLQHVRTIRHTGALRISIEESANMADTLYMPKPNCESILKPQAKDEKERLTINISAERASELRRYAKFLNDSDVSYVVDQALGNVFSRDRAFAKWVKDGNGANPELAAKPVAPTSEQSLQARKQRKGEPANVAA